MGVEWLDSYKVGHESVDASTKKLFELTNAFLASDDLTVLRPVIVALCKQAKTHFELEEALMRRISFPGMEAHMAQHQRLLDRLIGRSMDVFITKLRKYLKDDPDISIVNVHGTGFRLEVKE